MGRLTKRSNKTSHENGVCCTHFMSKECVQFGGECAWGCKWEEAAWGKLADYEDAEEQGLLLRLPAPLDDVESFEIADKGIWMKIPCRQGDTVYEIDGITWKGHDWKYRSYESAFVKETVFRFEMLSEIGKTVFLTKEEAEQALARMEKDNG